MEIIFLAAGIVIGLFIGILFAKSKYSSNKGIPFEEVESIKTDKTKAEEKNKFFELTVSELKHELESVRNKYSETSNDFVKVTEQNENLKLRLKEHKEEIENIQESFRNEFKNLANEILEDKSKRFTDQNKELVQGLLNPLGDKINEFQKRINDIHHADTQSRSSLLEQIKTLSELNKQMSHDADNLTKALKGDSKTQGTWGEFILESVLEKSGLVKGDQYKVQESHKSEDGKRYQPDVVVYLPDNKNIIVDSKVSLVAYERFVSSDNENDKAVFLKDHIRSIGSHIKNLSEKKYQTLYDLNSPDFVLLFIPIEPAFALAVQNEPNLFYDAFERNIVIVSPSTLLATLRTIESIWRQENQNKNALEIARQSGALYDKFVGFVEDLSNIGKKIDSTKESYDSAMKKLSEGSGNIVRRVENLKDLGAKATKTLSNTLLEQADD